MICMLAAQPVSPTSQLDPTGPGGGGGGEASQSTRHHQQEEEEADHKLAMPNDPIVGVDVTIFDKNGPGALEPIAISSPTDMSPAQMAKHVLTHIPMDLRCPMCRACRTPNQFHMILTRI